MSINSQVIYLEQAQQPMNRALYDGNLKTVVDAIEKAMTELNALKEAQEAMRAGFANVNASNPSVGSSNMDETAMVNLIGKYAGRVNKYESWSLPSGLEYDCLAIMVKDGLNHLVRYDLSQSKWFYYDGQSVS